MRRLFLLLSIIPFLGFAIYRILVGLYCSGVNWDCYGHSHWFITETVVALCIVVEILVIIAWLYETDR